MRPAKFSFRTGLQSLTPYLDAFLQMKEPIPDLKILFKECSEQWNCPIPMAGIHLIRSALSTPYFELVVGFSGFCFIRWLYLQRLRKGLDPRLIKAHSFSSWHSIWP